MFSKKIKGALFIASQIVFYKSNGELSFIKCALFAGALYYFAFIIPLMLMGILELSIIFFAFYLIAKLVMVAFNEGLEAYS